MKVRCGACRTQFEVAGAGRFACPVCGSVNVVRNGGAGPAPADQAPPPPPGMGGYPSAPGAVPGGAPQGQQPPPPPKPEQPMPKIECPDCGFTFIVGMVPTVTCPNCTAEVATGIDSDEDE